MQLPIFEKFSIWQCFIFHKAFILISSIQHTCSLKGKSTVGAFDPQMQNTFGSRTKFLDATDSVLPCALLPHSLNAKLQTWK